MSILSARARELRLGFMVAFLLALIPSMCWAKDKIAVFPFRTAVYKDYRMTDQAETEMVSLLVNQRRFDVIERDQLANILKEQSMGMTGVIDVSQAVEIGKISGVRYLVLGTVTNVNYKCIQKRNDQGQIYNEVDALFVMDVRIVDVQTAAVLFSNTFTAKPGGGLLGGLIGGGGDLSTDPETQLSSMVKRLYEKEISKKILEAFPMGGSIISLMDKQAVIDIGSDQGVKKGMKFDVIMQQQKESPTTKKVITIDYKVGRVEVCEVSGVESAICKIKDGGDAIKEGMLVKFAK